MDFAFTDEQEMIRESAHAFLADVSTSAAVRAAMATERGYDEALWGRICNELCWQAIHIPEAYGGLGLGFVELAILLEQMGQRLLCSPFLSTVGLATNALLLAGSEAQKRHWLGQIAEGRLTATLAWTGAGGGYEAASVAAEARLVGGEYVLSGTLRHVPDGHTADLLIVAARTPGSEGESGISLFAVPADTVGVERCWLPTMDQTRRQAEICLDQVRLECEALLGEAGEAGPALTRTLQLAAVCVAAEQLGGAQAVLDLTVDYTKERVQFGRPVAGFQAIKHRAADMMLQVEASRSAVYYAACVAQEALFGGEAGAELPLAASLAKAWCSDAFFHCASESIQLHGGVGFTWEYDPHLYFKRARSSETFLGASAWHREKIAQAIL
ncbi:acyl-CoA dehydrogenase family protein [Marinobacterium aestuariivivens]|uniref:Acyl-CoA dehydrogenase family protein n=1 Tax=Marinobacterium aestuariivivens TaxID=1698799 RepID=A0ABW2A3J0_9GAMM